MLVADKLNVKKKLRSNLFNWRGQFTPQLVEYLLREFAKPKDVVLDPFAGSGTVLQESARIGLNAYGFEINPAAYAMSKFFSFSRLTNDQRKRLIDQVAEIILSTVSDYKVLPVCKNDNNNFRESYVNFNEFSKALLVKSQERAIKLVILNILFKAESLKNYTIYDATSKAFGQVKRALFSLNFTECNIDAFLCDARHIDKKSPQKANLIITSPPYINVFNYHQNYRSIMELMGFDLLKVANSEFGSNRKNRGNRFRTVIQYCLDIEEALYSMLAALEKQGLGVLIIGKESNVRGVPFYNSKIVGQIIQTIDGFKMLSNEKRVFNNKFGNRIVEDILIFQKIGTSDRLIKGYEIANENLLKALDYSNLDVKNDILDAIDNLEVVKPSPILNIKDFISNGKFTSSR